MTYLDLKIGNIHLTDRLGTGGMGTVYVGFDEKLQREVAVKAIRGDRVDAETRARLLREARLLSQLDHPNICRIHDYIEGDISDYLILELVPGESLAEALESDIEPAIKLRLAEQVAQALAAAHARGIIHRDLKPTNIMLTPEGQAKVLDFGLARSLEPREGEWTTGEHATLDPSLGQASVDAGEETGRGHTERDGHGCEDRRHDDTLPDGEVPTGARLGRLSASIRTEPGLVLGTASYMSPEQARGQRVTASSDVYSLGLVLQELFTEKPPYPVGLARELILTMAADGDALPVAGVQADVATVIGHMRSVAPTSRPTAAEVADRLRWIRERPRRRFRRIVSWACAAIALLAGLLYIGHLRQQRDQAVRGRTAAEEAWHAAEQTLAGRARLLEETVETRETTFGREHPEVAAGHRDAGLFFELAGDEPRAAHHYRQALEILLTLERFGEARPIADKMIARQWGDAELWQLCRDHGLVLD
ncbi:MAG: protein kinase [Acidobacteriota bacterium]